MNSEQLLLAIGAVNDDAVRDAGEFAADSRPRFRRRLSTVLIAAILAVLLLGAGVTAVLRSGSIQNFFSHYFTRVTGQEMGETQADLIDRLSQEIGASQTVGDVTVTVDSATVGDDCFFLLLRIEGRDFSHRHSYNFDGTLLETEPDPIGAGGSWGYSMENVGIDDRGAALLLIQYSYLNDVAYAANTEPLTVRLLLQDLVQGHSENRKLLQTGQWDFEFVIDRSEPPASVTLPDTEIMLVDLSLSQDERTEVPGLLTNIELTSTGLRFRYDARGGALAIDGRISLTMKNGVTLHAEGGNGGEMADSTVFVNTYQWSVPVELTDVAVLSIDGVEIPVDP